ncbi:hypothetical protein BRADI_4g02836v3 [Brachypodium distachyon]|uniref:lipoyl(octanoyl) transferase n=1 Tax=Brachypodium distachyon TaxID=15368 RepID=A0A0Q3PAE7_BRADI|nr:hypothetical protein BRADI_4g02836v3 [Brachypodium distachyon]
MVVSAPLCQGVLPFPVTAAARDSSAGSRRGRLCIAAGCRSGPATAPTNAAPVADAAPVSRRRNAAALQIFIACMSFIFDEYSNTARIQQKKLKITWTRRTATSPVYTLGTSSREEYLHFNVEDAPFEIHRIDRGDISWPWTGIYQLNSLYCLVMYLILNLRYQKIDRKGYLRALEKVIIRALQSAFSIKASTKKGLTGVSVGDQKVAGIGIHVSRHITYHGLELNVTTDLTPFESIIPCGIKDRGVGSIKEILQKSSKGTKLNDEELMDIAYKSLIQEFSEDFQLSIELSPDFYIQQDNNIK